MEFALFVLAGAALACLPTAWSRWRASRSPRGEWVVACPETRRAAVVEVAVWRGVERRGVAVADLHLAACSRWPVSEDCDQECVAQFAAFPRRRIARRAPVLASLPAAVGSDRRAKAC